VNVVLPPACYAPAAYHDRGIINLTTPILQHLPVNPPPSDFPANRDVMGDVLVVFVQLKKVD